MTVKKIISLVLACLTVSIMLAGCKTEPSDGEGADAPKEIFIGADSIGDYVVIRSEASDDETTAAASKLYFELQKRFGDTLDKEIAFFKLNTKLPFLITDDETQYEVWKEWWPEANKYICENKHLPLRTRMVQLVYKLVYGVIYR